MCKSNFSQLHLFLRLLKRLLKLVDTKIQNQNICTMLLLTVLGSLFGPGTTLLKTSTSDFVQLSIITFVMLYPI